MTQFQLLLGFLLHLNSSALLRNQIPDIPQKFIFPIHFYYQFSFIQNFFTKNYVIFLTIFFLCHLIDQSIYFLKIFLLGSNGFFVFLTTSTNGVIYRLEDFTGISLVFIKSKDRFTSSSKTIYIFWDRKHPKYPIKI